MTRKVLRFKGLRGGSPRFTGKNWGAASRKHLQKSPALRPHLETARLTCSEHACIISIQRRKFVDPQMVWVIIGCTLLIIVCLGGGRRLGQIILGALALIVAVLVLASDWIRQIPPITIIELLIVAVGFITFRILRRRKVNLDLAKCGDTTRLGRPTSRKRQTSSTPTGSELVDVVLI
ncbi:hypothetical protein AB4Z51_44165 [Bradyrhizobium sp. 2TAF36]|uniref:hypothetical protein n=1 Tax=Bradyrhizobium sp. 2TAF36 TaxID=3233016 RepID=UPI003F8F0CA3